MSGAISPNFSELLKEKNKSMFDQDEIKELNQITVLSLNEVLPHVKHYSDVYKAREELEKDFIKGSFFIEFQ